MGRYGSIPSHNVLKRRKSGSGRAGRGAEAAFLGVNFTGGVPQSLRGGWLGSGSYPPADDVMRLFAPGQIHHLGPAPINSEKRPQVDTSFSRPVWPQFFFYPLRGITQRTQSDQRWLRSGFVEVGNRSASSCPKSSMVPTSLLRSRALGTPEFSFRPNRSPGRPLCTWASGFQQRNGLFTTINFWSKSSATPPAKIISKKWVLV